MTAPGRPKADIDGPSDDKLMKSRMGKPKKFTAKQFKDAIPESGGIVTVIAKRVGCSWNTAASYIKDTPTVARAYADECERMLDLAEGALYISIKDGNTQDAKWVLSRKGKHRGWGDGVEVTGPNRGPLIITWDDGGDNN